MSWKETLAKGDKNEIRAFIEDALERLDSHVEDYIRDVFVHLHLSSDSLPAWFEDLADKVYNYDVSGLSPEQRAYRWKISPVWSRFEKLDLSDLLDMYEIMTTLRYRADSNPFKRRILEKIKIYLMDAEKIVKEYGEENFLRLVKCNLLKSFEGSLKNLPLLWKAYEKLGKNPANMISPFGAQQEAIGRTKQEFIEEFGQEVYGYVKEFISSYLVPDSGLDLSNLDAYVQELTTFASKVTHDYSHDYTQYRERFKRVLKEALDNYSLSDLAELKKSTLVFFLNLGILTKKQYIVAIMEVGLEDHHAFGDRKESLTYLSNLVNKNNNSLTWDNFLDQTGLTQENDKQHYLFFRNIFTHQPKHTVTSQALENIKADEVLYPLSYDTYDGDQQNTTRTEQLLIKLDLPPQYQHMIDSDQVVKAFFNHIMRNTRIPGHPDCFAWARVSLINNNEWLVDEIQSDFMYGFSNSPGLATYRAKPELLQNVNISDNAFKRIDGVMSKLLGNWHQVLLSAVMQAARNNNVKHVHMGDIDHMKEKASITSTNKLNKIYDKLPQDFHFKKKEISIPVKGVGNLSKPFWTREARVIKRYLKSKRGIHE